MLLDVLQQQIDEFHSGGAVNLGAMRDIVSYLCEFADLAHHPREDAAFARLVARDPTLQLSVNRLLQEHRVIAAAGEELMMRLDEAIVGAVVSRSSIEAPAALYVAYYRHHLAIEEREILPRAVRLLTAEDWNAVESAATEGTDPMFDGGNEGPYPELRLLLASRTSPAD